MHACSGSLPDDSHLTSIIIMPYKGVANWQTTFEMWFTKKQQNVWEMVYRAIRVLQISPRVAQGMVEPCWQDEEDTVT